MLFVTFLMGGPIGGITASPTARIDCIRPQMRKVQPKSDDLPVDFWQKAAKFAEIWRPLRNSNPLPQD